MNNPLRYTDPTGMAPSDFIKDKNGNLHVEKGDNAEKLKKEYGVTVTDKNFKFKEGNVIVLDKKNETKESEKTGWKEPTDKVNTVVGTGATVIENGGKFTKAAHVLGEISFVAGVASDGIGAYNYSQNPDSPNAVHPAKALTNTGIAAAGAGYLGEFAENPIGATLYFGVDCFYPGGWTGNKEHQGAIKDMDDNYQANKAIDPTWQMFPGAMKQ